MPRLRTLAPWLLAALALAWALAPSIPGDRFAAIAPLVGLALLALLLILALALHLHRRRRRASLPDPQRERDTRRRRTLQRSCAAARKRRPAHIWLCLGLPRHGKTTLITATGPRATTIGESSPDLPALQFRHPGRELLLEHPGTTCDLTPLRRLRRRQPIDAILLTLALPELLGDDPTILAAPLRRQLAASLEDLAVDVPIYLVCTKLDRLAGHLELDPGDTAWGFELAAPADLPRQLARWIDWAAARRITRLAAEPDPTRRARLFTFAAQFNRACERLTALADDLFAPLPGLTPRLRGVYFTTLHPDPLPPSDRLLTELATSLHTRLRPEFTATPPIQPAPPRSSPPANPITPSPLASSHADSIAPSPPTSPHDAIAPSPLASPHADPIAPSRLAPSAPRPTDLSTLLATLRSRAPEAVRSPAHRRARQRRRLALALVFAALATGLALTALDLARALHHRLQAVADLGADLGAIEPAPPLLALRAELDAWRAPARPGLARLLTPDLAPALRATYQRWARERLLRPRWQELERRLQRGLLTASAPDLHGLLRAYLLLTVPEDMPYEPSPIDPEQRDWLLAELAELIDLTAPTPELQPLLATLFTQAAANELRFPRDHALVERARAQLRHHDDDELLIQTTLTAAASHCEPLTLAALSHTRQLVAERSIPCSFTRDSWPRVQEQLLRAAERGDDWVLGRTALPHADTERLARLRSRHDALYIAAWTDFLHGLRLRRPTTSPASRCCSPSSPTSPRRSAGCSRPSTTTPAASSSSAPASARSSSCSATPTSTSRSAAPRSPAPSRRCSTLRSPPPSASPASTATTRASPSSATPSRPRAATRPTSPRCTSASRLPSPTRTPCSSSPTCAAFVPSSPPCSSPR